MFHEPFIHLILRSSLLSICYELSCDVALIIALSWIRVTGYFFHQG